MSEGVATEKTPTNSKVKERWEQNADDRLRGRESKMKQKGVSANFHNVALMKPFMITDRHSQKCSFAESSHTHISFAGSSHTHILIPMSTFPALLEV